MPINLFLDSNILLSFYKHSDSKIEQLRDLSQAISDSHIKLFVNDQLVSEVKRNRDTTIEEALKKFKSFEFNCQIPSYINSLDGVKDLPETLKKANTIHSNIVTNVRDLIDKRELPADEIITKLLAKKQLNNNEEKQYKAALRRFQTGRPPGKKKTTLGDELNWEFLLEQVPNNEDLHLISKDSDFASPTNKKDINFSLLEEWEEKKNSNIHFYTNLNDFSTFYNSLENLTKIRISENQAELDLLISFLRESGSFATTHLIIADFPQSPNFTDKQINDLENVFISNSQVNQICTDSDVTELFNKERFPKERFPSLWSYFPS